ncbi:Tyrosine-protein kinase [Fasciolopsis buskii]|uniref:Tyrosine-protein kinase n=1 Tax=Fasciolopsis buskii TaxID=27845 RepID=A0A8E0S1N8_9TREM|nr:Tyrosine-protein kinase [Fasciolopsis buski]
MEQQALLGDFFALQNVCTTIHLSFVSLITPQGQSVMEALSGPMRAHLRHLVYKELHLCQPWYHHTIRRREAEHRLAEDGNYEGSFLVRFRREDATFVLSLCCQSAPKHYKIEERFGRLSIEDDRSLSSQARWITMQITQTGGSPKFHTITFG